ncbi:uncharacterized protein LOC129948829 [Eupeodes corollae]|uniref:uncharacterized protein LOC129948829 n=1 Tax=Eupeodes corollae TaxID=290404 RepID=UPI00248FD872|nr:uncharacterized protein LOC129948829 [Eupeodes corollae]
MSFKIIQELNNRNQTVLTIIPSSFEQNGVYWFPPSNWSTKKLNNIIKNPYAKPDKSFWEARPCVVKKSNILTFAQAEEHEDALLDKNITEADDADAGADADDDSEESFNQPTTKRNTIQFSRSPQADFNVLLDQNLLEVQGGNSDIIFNDLELVEVQPQASHFDISSGVTPTPDGYESKILANQVKIINELEVIKEIVMTGIAKLLTQVDQRVIDEKHNVIKEAAEDFQKISTEVQAQQFEENLMETSFKCEMVRKTSFFIGKNGKRFGQGWTCCYELVDAIFVRNFLTKCSWTGCSKKYEEGKIPFFKFKNILILFAEVVVEADPQFSLEKTKDFSKKS